MGIWSGCDPVLKISLHVFVLFYLSYANYSQLTHMFRFSSATNSWLDQCYRWHILCIWYDHKGILLYLYAPFLILKKVKERTGGRQGPKKYSDATFFTLLSGVYRTVVNFFCLLLYLYFSGYGTEFILEWRNYAESKTICKRFWKILKFYTLSNISSYTSVLRVLIGKYW